jgi:hypothetical protein
MTEILETPDPAEWTCEWTCGNCKAKLRSTGADVGIGQFGAMGDYTSMFYVECPRCGRCKTWKTHGSELPAHVQHEARVSHNATSS